MEDKTFAKVVFLLSPLALPVLLPLLIIPGGILGVIAAIGFVPGCQDFCVFGVVVFTTYLLGLAAVPLAASLIINRIQKYSIFSIKVFIKVFLYNLVVYTLFGILFVAVWQPIFMLRNGVPLSGVISRDVESNKRKIKDEDFVPLVGERLEVYEKFGVEIKFPDGFVEGSCNKNFAICLSTREKKYTDSLKNTYSAYMVDGNLVKYAQITIIPNVNYVEFGSLSEALDVAFEQITKGPNSSYRKVINPEVIRINTSEAEFYFIEHGDKFASKGFIYDEQLIVIRIDNRYLIWKSHVEFEEGPGILRYIVSNLTFVD